MEIRRMMLQVQLKDFFVFWDLFLIIGGGTVDEKVEDIIYMYIYCDRGIISKHDNRIHGKCEAI